MKNQEVENYNAVNNAIHALAEVSPTQDVIERVAKETTADAIATEASTIIKRAAGLVMDQIEETQKKLDNFREELIARTVHAENTIKSTMMAIGQIGLSAVEFDKQVDGLISGPKSIQ